MGRLVCFRARTRATLHTRCECGAQYLLLGNEFGRVRLAGADAERLEHRCHRCTLVRSASRVAHAPSALQRLSARALRSALNMATFFSSPYFSTKLCASVGDSVSTSINNGARDARLPTRAQPSDAARWQEEQGCGYGIRTEVLAEEGLQHLDERLVSRRCVGGGGDYVFHLSVCM